LLPRRAVEFVSNFTRRLARARNGLAHLA